MKWFLGNVASGSAAGATTSLLLYHLDYARTRLGTDARECRIKGERQFKGLLDVYSKTLSSDGAIGLYRGFGASMIGITLYRGMYFGIYDTMKPIILVGPFEVITFSVAVSLHLLSLCLSRATTCFQFSVPSFHGVKI